MTCVLERWNFEKVGRKLEEMQLRQRDDVPVRLGAMFKRDHVTDVLPVEVSFASGTLIVRSIDWMMLR